MTDTRHVMESPSGLDLHPDPPATARISKKVGVAVLGVVVFVGVLVVYGLYARREQQQVDQAKNEEKHPEPARRVGDQLVKELAPPAVASPAPVISGRTGLDPWQGSGAMPESGTLQPPRLVYHDDGKEGRSETGEGRDGVRSSPGGPSEPSAEEKLRVAAFRQEQEAFAAPTAIRGGSSLPGSATAPLNDPSQQFGPLASLLGAAKGVTDASTNNVVPASAQTPNGQRLRPAERTRAQVRFYRTDARSHRQ